MIRHIDDEDDIKVVLESIEAGKGLPYDGFCGDDDVVGVDPKTGQPICDKDDIKDVLLSALSEADKHLWEIQRLNIYYNFDKYIEPKNISSYNVVVTYEEVDVPDENKR